MLDIRIPIGLLFSILGVLLLAYGLGTLSDPDLYAKSLNININIWSGIIMTIFGGLMLAWAKLPKKTKQE